jgi:curved DNA-binding protein CbpA
MQNLYDLLGVRPDDDTETIKKAFRTAAKASHPDHHGDDPEAAARFRQISKAYGILRDPEQRAAYDRLLESKRRPLRHKAKRSWSGMKRHVVKDLMAGALLAIVLAVGYKLFVSVHNTPGVGTAGAASRESRQAAADRPAERTGAAGHEMRERAPAPQMPIAMPTAPAPAASAAIQRDRPQTANGEAVSSPAGQKIAVAGRDSESDGPGDAGVPGKTGGEPPARHEAPSAPSVDPPSSAAEERNSGLAADDRRDGATPDRTPEPAGANTGSVKPSEIRVSARAPAAAPPPPKRHAPNRRPIEQAALAENRNTPDNRNTPPESRHAPAAAPDSAPNRVFGVGF